VADTLSDPLWEEYREIAREFGLRACWSAPVFATDGKVLGTFAMYYREPRSPTAADLELIGRAAHIASIAIERQRSEEELRGANERLQGMSRRLVELQEAERRHVARELHDEIGQLLTALKMTLPARSRSDRAGASANLKKARGLVHELTSRVRELSMDLRPAMLDDLAGR
jgi:signal transduction histidine kinase